MQLQEVREPTVSVGMQKGARVTIWNPSITTKPANIPNQLNTMKVVFVSIIVVASCITSTLKAQGSRTYVFQNSTNHEVTLNLVREVIPINGITQLKLPAGVSQSYVIAGGTPTIRVDLTGGQWKVRHPIALGFGPLDSAAGTYVIE